MIEKRQTVRIRCKYICLPINSHNTFLKKLYFTSKASWSIEVWTKLPGLDEEIQSGTDDQCYRNTRMKAFRLFMWQNNEGLTLGNKMHSNTGPDLLHDRVIALPCVAFNTLCSVLPNVLHFQASVPVHLTRDRNCKNFPYSRLWCAKTFRITNRYNSPPSPSINIKYVRLPLVALNLIV